MAFWFNSFLADLLVSVLLLIVSAIIYVKWTYGYWKRHNIMQLNPKFFVGDTEDIFFRAKSSSLVFKSIYDQIKASNKPIGGFYLGLRKELMVLDLDIIKSILVKDFAYFTDRGVPNDDENDPLTAHLFALDGTKWKNMRTKLTPTFTSGKMKMMFSTLQACSDELNNIIEDKTRLSEPVDIKEILARFTTDVIGSCAFGIDCNCLRNPNTDFRKYGQAAFEPELLDRYKTLFAFIFPGLFKFLKMKQLNATISDFFMNVVKDTVRYREENNIVRKDFMQLLIQLKNLGKISNDESDMNIINGDESVKGITIEQVAAQCFVFFLAGFETSSTTMTFCLYELAKNQELQDKVREEIRSVYNKHDGKMTYEAIQDMKYMDQCINETLRKYPPLAFLVRNCTKDYKIPNTDFVMKKDGHIRLSVLGIQRDPDIYPDPEKFDPERFTEEEKSRRHPMAFLPFGEGPRNCIGARFGLMQSKVGLAALLNNYRFTLNNKTKEPLDMDPASFIMSTKGGIWLDSHLVV